MGLLDTIVGASAAYSTRKLRRAINTVGTVEQSSGVAAIRSIANEMEASDG